MPGAGCSVPDHQERWDTSPRPATDPPACWSMPVHGLFGGFHPSSSPRPGPGLAPSSPPSPGLAPSWALGARVTVSGLAGPRPGLCQLAVAAATSHYLARPAREGQGDPRPANRQPPWQREEVGRKQALPRPCMCPQPESSPAPLLGHSPCPPGCSWVPPSLPPPGRSWKWEGEGVPAACPSLAGWIGGE